jgi:hypothetical protein
MTRFLAEIGIRLRAVLLLLSAVPGIASAQDPEYMIRFQVPSGRLIEPGRKEPVRFAMRTCPVLTSDCIVRPTVTVDRFDSGKPVTLLLTLVAPTSTDLRTAAGPPAPRGWFDARILGERTLTDARELDWSQVWLREDSTMGEPLRFALVDGDQFYAKIRGRKAAQKAGATPEALVLSFKAFSSPFVFCTNRSRPPFKACDR